jgi:DedD protein
MDIALKQRLVGATVLIALAVIVLPMLLGGRPEGSIAQSRKIEIPAQPEELDFETRRFPVGEKPVVSPVPDTPRPLPSPTRNGESSAETESGTISREGPASNEQEDAPEAQEQVAQAADRPGRVEPSVSPPAPAADPSAVDAGRYVVQVASFGSIGNANRLSETLGSHGYSVMLDSVKSDVGTLHRVRVGPYATESQANEAVTRLKAQVDSVNPRVMDLRPDKAAPVSTLSDPLVRWVVQVGSFSSAANADRLVEQIRQESLSAYLEEVESGGKRIYRVRVGPYLEREEAIRVDQLIADKFSLDGVVMSAQ